MLKVVLDTNIIVSAALKSESSPSFILSLALLGNIKMCVSQKILREYEEVLSRKKFGFNYSAVLDLMREIKENSVLVNPKEKIKNLIDEKDSHIIECAIAADAKYIITGNTKHFPKKIRGTRIVSISEFISIIFLSKK